MKRKNFILPTLIMIGILFTLLASSHAHAQTSEPVVHAVLFYSPSCPHCHKVIQEDLPPLIEKYSNQLDIIGIDVSQPGGQTLYQAAIQHFAIPENRLGVPTLIVNDVVLVGSLEIPEQFPGLIEKHLAQGGVDWPDIPGLSEALPPTPEVEEATATVTPQSINNPATATNSSQFNEHDPNWHDKLALDPAGNTLAVFVLIGMLVSILWAISLFRNQAGISLVGNWSWLVPAICLVGFGVAGYLAYVETTQVDAVCGPVGDCNTVQQSEYARLFGILSIGVLGLVGYIAITIVWIIARFSNGALTDLATLALLTITTMGTLFSIYLTFLEPFVIGATCAWCLSSSVLMTILMLLSVRPAKLAISNISHSSSLYRERARIGGHDN